MALQLFRPRPATAQAGAGLLILAALLVVKTTTYLTDRQHIPALQETRARHLDPARPPANTLIVVSGLARAELLLEIEAVAELRTAAGR